MPWEVEPTPTAQKWMNGLSERDFQRIAGPLAALKQHGPDVGTPFVKRINGSRHHNMKELRSSGGNLRVLFAFDSQRKAILLVGGDKTNQWQSWYERNIPLADRLYTNHLRSTGRGNSVRHRQVGGRAR